MAGDRCSDVELFKQHVQHQLLKLDEQLNNDEQQLKLLKARASPSSAYIHSLIDSLEAELDRNCLIHSAYSLTAERLCAEEVSEAGLTEWADTLYENARRSHEICWSEMEERRGRARSAPQHNPPAAHDDSPQQPVHAISAAVSTKKRRRAKSTHKHAQHNGLLKQETRVKHQPRTPSSAPLRSSRTLSSNSTDAILVFSSSASASSSSPATSSASSSLSPSSLSPLASDIDEIADGGLAEHDGSWEDEEEEDDDDDDSTSPPPPPAYNTPYLLPPVRFTEHSRSTLAKLLTFDHELPFPHFSILCLPIPQPFMPPSSWTPLAQEAHRLLCEMNRDGGRGSSNGYYLLLVAASSLIVSASYLVLKEDSGTYTLAVNCFCTRKELQGRGCARVLYEAIRELRCRVSQWLSRARPGCSGCRLVVHSVDETVPMWQTRFGLRPMQRGQGSGGYTNTVALIDGRRDKVDMRAEWLERIVHNTSGIFR